MGDMNRKQKKELVRILLAGGLLAAAIALEVSSALPKAAVLVLYMAAYLIVGLETVIKAGKNIFRGQVFDENFLMALATVGAIGLGEMREANAVMLFYQIGELFESCAVDKSRKSISSLMDIRPDYANVLRDGKEVKVDPYDVAVGEIIVVKPGEKIPMDGQVVEGVTSIDTAALTGEAEPRTAEVGDEVISGCINRTGVIQVRVTKEFGESTVSKILDLVENATSKKANVEKFITRFAQVYTPLVCLAALVTAVVPPLVLDGGSFSVWIYRALSFLVISCPCALVISVPLAFFGGIGGAGRLGILVKGSNYLEALAKTETVVLDKTGTLTTGSFEIEDVRPEAGYTEERVLALAAYAESYSHHPISQSIVKAYAVSAGQEVDTGKIDEVKEIAGRGVQAKIQLDGREVTVAAGSEKLMRDLGITGIPEEESTVVYIAADGVYAGRITFADKIKKDSFALVRRLAAVGVRQTVMLTGDKRKTAEKVAKQIGIDRVKADLLPQQKVEEIEALLSEKSAKRSVVFVGDGINDAPVLARADVGVAMGALGSDAAIEAADVVIMTDEPSRLASAIGIAKKTTGIARQNVVFALFVKFAVLILAAVGAASMWAAIFADVGVAMLAILNSIRALHISRFEKEAA